MSPELLFTILSGLGIFVLVLSLWFMALVMWSQARETRSRRIGQRLGLTPEGPENGRTLRLWLDGREVETAVGRRQSAGLGAQFAGKCRDAGWEVPPQTIMLTVLGLMCAAYVLVVVYSNNAIAAVGISGSVAAVFWLYMHHRIHRRRTLFDNQLIDALELAARSLRVGHALTNAFRLVSEEVSAPIGPMFGSIVQQQELGVSMDEAIRQTAQTSGSDDLKLFATAVIIQIRSGGNLADMMERVAAVMRDRLRLGRRVRVLIAQAQFSKYILLSLPVFMFILLNLMNPVYMHPLYQTTPGKVILGAAVGFLVIGALIMNWLATIHY